MTRVFSGSNAVSPSHCRHHKFPLRKQYSLGQSFKSLMLLFTIVTKLVRSAGYVFCRSKRTNIRSRKGPVPVKPLELSHSPSNFPLILLDSHHTGGISNLMPLGER